MARRASPVMISTAAAQVVQGQRKPRIPQHSFNLKTRPWQIQPFCIAPVLPGESMQNALFQARIVSDPLKSPLMGWWAEHYLFYVKHRDLEERDLFTAMVLQYGTSMASAESATDVAANYHTSGIDWVAKCLERVVDEYFRDEGDVSTDWTIDGVPIGRVTEKNWMDSIIDATDVVAGAPLPDDADNANMDDLDQMQRQYALLYGQQMTNLDYEDWLRMYGVRLGKEEPHKPELLRYWRSWTYPTNTINPAGGAPSSAVSWSITERADKDRFFREPGFLFGVQICRPKVYLGNQKQAAVHMLNDAMAWLPAVLADDPATSMKLFANNAGPLEGIPTNSYWVDVRDLFLYGDQFVNHDLSEWANKITTPNADLTWQYAEKTDAEALFVDTTTPGTSADSQFLRTDGIITFRILSSMASTDFTGRMPKP